MTSPSGNRLSICPLRFRIASPRVPIDRGEASVNRNSWGGDPEAKPRSIETLGEAILNLSGQIDLPITLETSHYLFTIICFIIDIGSMYRVYIVYMSNIIFFFQVYKFLFPHPREI